MTEAVRWAILGTGKIARAFATALRDTPGAVLAGVASRSLEGAQAFGAEFGAAACYGSYQALADAGDIDVVYIGTPHPMHVENAMMALDGGKGVLCEKPFTMNRREAEQIVALAREKKLFLMEAMWTRFMPALAEVRRIIASGEIGSVHQVTADFGFAGTQDPLHRLNNPELGGGGLLDLGIYPLSIAAALLGPVADVRAMALMGETGVDIQTGFTMTHEGGGMSVCSCSLRARTPAELTVSGSLGQVRMNTMFHRAQSVTVTTADGARTIDTPYLGNGYVHEAMEVGRCLKEGLLESPGMPLDETLHLMGVLDTMRGQIGLRYPSDA
ncbi:Gfo/Idh/MocA family protein [Massilia antarctica]|uniref:Gfo/Idh/MocA family protein n=1 Tax=Massilia antarctica TaxID=2765360 RepID=UPI0006BB6ED3|nr:Gfo/Idh/MocA family oxidoreductase [Massilia sp. H27-R4]MCY0915423.1 Gfo/Idh/MocA family oxidoreductase [Massilia sp. H27-R4]CUI05887.1 putative oxidoreductase [Janthinobacterium sp. CG23_2]CUU29673.1 putative oxidoreductase [Janthinobacterium sp. CG23_2]